MRKETGSAHVIIVGILTVALIGAIGFIFWQNVLNKDDKKGDAVAASTKEPAKADATKKYCSAVEKICFDYPMNWKVDTQTVDPDKDGVSEKVTVSDDSGKKWLQLQTGLTGVGGACGDEEGSYVKILKTHTSGIEGSYLVSKGAENDVMPQTYAVSSIAYSGPRKAFSVSMELNTAKTGAQVGKIGPCDLGIDVFPGKNVEIHYSGGTTGHGSVEFSSVGSDLSGDYSSEAEASAALSTSDANKAFEVLKSARYE